MFLVGDAKAVALLARSTVRAAAVRLAVAVEAGAVEFAEGDGGASGVEEEDGVAVLAGMSRPDSVQATQAKRRAAATTGRVHMVRNVSRSEPPSLHAGSAGGFNGSVQHHV